MFTESQLTRYSRHFVLPQIGVKGQKKLMASKVLVIGGGALGSAALLYLAGAGIGTLGIADGDTVELSNLQRQIIHRTDSAGKNKVDSARAAIGALNPDVQAVTYPQRVTADNFCEIVRDYDFVIDGTDRFESKFLINDGCVLLDKPYVHGGAVGFTGQAMTWVPGGGPCLRCLLGSVPPRETALTCAQNGVLGPAAGIIGCIQASEAIKYLLGIGDLLCGRVLQLDALNMKFSTTGFSAADPSCPVCGGQPSIRSLADRAWEYDLDGSCCGK